MGGQGRLFLKDFNVPLGVILSHGPQLTRASGPPYSGTLRKDSKQAWVPGGMGPTYDLGVFAFFNKKYTILIFITTTIVFFKLPGGP